MVNNLCDFYNLLGRLEGRQYIETFISYNVSLINAKLKPSITLTVKKKDAKGTFYLWNTHGKQCIDKMNLCHIVLKEDKENFILLIYDYYQLKKCLVNPENNRFLKMIGYHNTNNIEDVLAELQERYAECNCPHELGIFLGYPINDVKSFIDNPKKKCLLCGYWKVYSNKEEAKKMFRRFDDARNNAICSIVEKCSIDVSL
ncbi:hypothetical protein CM240_3220 [Clostridium bornimense]|uniref:DUF3793 domain-containing protein n=1 Tax=Clostridium bornimense TaxID=1216932 RepID=W6S7E9_9CLOT|nr:DUF3793 family protein [Clostridium bornimense]CDM70337.1 hypothetical protein CM240_3220 [Clostridium bornimense]